MKTICLLESVSRADGGIFEAECALQRHLVLEQGVNVEVIGLEDQFTSQDAGRWLPLIPKALPVNGPRAFGYSLKFGEALEADADILYASSLWKYPSWAALQWAQKTGKPMLVVPHGSLDPWALRHSYWRKRVASLLFKDSQLHSASCLRALSDAEANSLRSYGLKNPICVIPNGVDLPESLSRPQRAGKRKLLFLGRIHPKKGLINCIRSFARQDKRRDWVFVIAGWDQGGHEAELIELCEELGLRVERQESKLTRRESEADVIFFGPAFGAEKARLFQSSDAFILPSLSEGLPMSVLEAWSYSLPVVMTPECNLHEGFQVDAAIRIECKSESLDKGLQLLFLMNESDLHAIGQRGRQLVEKRFTWSQIAMQIKEVYNWMMEGGVLPNSLINRL